MSDQLDIDAALIAAAFRESLEPADPLDTLMSALAAEFGGGPGVAGHQATRAEKAAAYRQFEARQRLYGKPPDREQIRGSLTPASASPMVRRIFGG